MKNPDANLYLAVSKNPISNGNNIEGYEILSGSSETWSPNAHSRDTNFIFWF